MPRSVARWSLSLRWLIAVVVACTCSCALGAARISYDRDCLTIDGRDTFVFSGAFHYFRCPRELWPDRFAKMKAAGLKTVETYVPWNYHEPNPPADVDDFSKVDLSELDEW